MDTLNALIVLGILVVGIGATVTGIVFSAGQPGPKTHKSRVRWFRPRMRTRLPDHPPRMSPPVPILPPAPTPARPITHVSTATRMRKL